jgi:branched-chain amino acid transport system ATP-binding protein
VSLISGLLQPNSGMVIFGGHDIIRLSVHDLIKVGIAHSFQLVNLFDQLTAFENVRLSILSRQDKTRRLLRLVNGDRDVWQEALEALDRANSTPNEIHQNDTVAQTLLGGSFRT